MRHQKRVGYTRPQLGACIIKEINERVNYTAIMNNVSRSFVIAVALAEYFGIDKQERFHEPNRKTKTTEKRVSKQNRRNRRGSANARRESEARIN